MIHKAGIRVRALGIAVAFLAYADTASTQTVKPMLRSVKDTKTGQVDILQGDRRVLRYNYQAVQPSEGYVDKVHANSRKYARARSNYIHPLYGLDGELLTRDWSVDHPHHRGIYWAWPEVDYGDQRGDLHALQRVFARPTDNIKLTDGDQFAEIDAENRWMWDDKIPIVRERAIIRAYRSGLHGQYVDLRFEFTALEDGVTVARRGTKNYGGLNIRLAPVKDLKIVTHTDPADAQPRRAWADVMGLFQGGKDPVGLALLQRQSNPECPGDWVQYPNLPWLQPTFPTAGTRFALSKDKPLVLQFRLWIHRGTPTSEAYAAQWSEYQKEHKD